MTQLFYNKPISFSRNKTPRLSLTLFLCLFFFSTLFANLCWEDEIFWLGFQAENSLKQIETSDFSWVSFCIFLFKYRLVLWLLPAIAGFFHRGSKLLVFFAGWLGFSLGYFITTMIRQFGFLSLPLTAAILFPQIILYFIAYIMLFQNEIHRSPAYLVKILILSGIYLVGVLCEYQVNPLILKTISQFFSVFSFPK